MSLLPDRHPQKDFFILDIADVMPKDDLASMEHPLFSLATKPDMRTLTYQNGDTWLEIVPSGIGLPTIFDKDILIFCISQLMEKKNRGLPIGKRVRFTAKELLIATNRRTGGVEYKRLDQSFTRLMGTVYKTNIKTNEKAERRFYNLIEAGSGFVFTERGGLDYCEVILSDWLFRAIQADEVATISPDYFRLRRPLERRLYELARKHCGNQKRWHIGLEKLKTKLGSNAPLKKLRLNIRQVVEADHLPFYSVELDSNDLVVFRPKQTANTITQNITLPDWAEDKAREIARDKGLDYYALRDRWVAFANKKIAAGSAPNNPPAAFIAYCKRQKAVR